MSSRHVVCRAERTHRCHYAVISWYRLLVECLRELKKWSPFGAITEYSEIRWRRSGGQGVISCALTWSEVSEQPERWLVTRESAQAPPACQSLTLGLLLFVEHHQVQRVVEVLGHLGNIMTRQSVGAVDGLVLHVCPVYTILVRRRGVGGGKNKMKLLAIYRLTWSHWPFFVMRSNFWFFLNIAEYGREPNIKTATLKNHPTIQRMFIHLHSNWSGLSVQFDIFWNMNMNKIHNNLKTATWLQNYALNWIFFSFFFFYRNEEI